MTPAGRKLPTPSPANPVYYTMRPLGQQDPHKTLDPLDDLDTPYGHIPQIPYADLQKQLEISLAANGYRPADIAHPATQMLLITWGHSSVGATLENYNLRVRSIDIKTQNPLWTTTITTDAYGLAFKPMMPVMITNASYYFGRETPVPVNLLKRAYKKTQVDIGAPTLIEYITGTTTATGTAAPAR